MFPRPDTACVPDVDKNHEATIWTRTIQSLGGANDAQEVWLRLQLEGYWMRFTLDDKGRINRVAWALEAQRTTTLCYYPLIIQDNTFNTNK